MLQILIIEKKYELVEKTELKLKDKFFYDTDPTLITAQIEKITRYPQRKQNLLDEIKRIEDSNLNDKEKKIENLKEETLLEELILTQ